MGLELKMLTRDEFVPIDNERYVAFTVSDFYGSLDFGYYQAEFHYEQIDSENGWFTGLSCCYDGRGDLPFNVPLRANDQGELYVLSSEEIEFYKYHKEENQRFWYIKNWFLHSGNNIIQPEELDELSIGIMLESDFAEQVVKANKIRVENKYGDKNELDI